MAWTTPKTWAFEEIPTSANMNTHLRDNLNFLKANIAFGASSELTIASGAVTKTQTYHTIDTESDAAADDLDTINGGSAGDVLIISSADDARVVTLKDMTGNLDLGGDVLLGSTLDRVMLMFNGTNWVPLAFTNVRKLLHVNGFQYPDLSAWVPTLSGAYLPASQTDEKVWLPLSLLEGDEVVSYTLYGDATESAALTLDCKLVRVDHADPITTADVAGGGITQIDADGDFAAVATLTAPEAVQSTSQYVLEIKGTTGAGDTITVMGAEVLINHRLNRGSD